MSRRKAFATVVDRPPLEITSPLELRRLRDAALKGMKSADWSSEISRLHLTGKISSVELANARRWSELVAAYSIASGAPSAPRSVQYDRTGGHASDPTSDAGKREAKRHERTVAEWLIGRDAMRKVGRDVEAIVDAVVISDRSCITFAELAALKAGLAALGAVWTAKRRAAR